MSDRDAAVIRKYGLLHEDGGPQSTDISRPTELLLDESGVIRFAAFTEQINARTNPSVLLEAAAALPKSP